MTHLLPGPPRMKVFRYQLPNFFELNSTKLGPWEAGRINRNIVKILYHWGNIDIVSHRESLKRCQSRTAYHWPSLTVLVCNKYLQLHFIMVTGTFGRSGPEYIEQQERYAAFIVRKFIILQTASRFHYVLHFVYQYSEMASWPGANRFHLPEKT